ncbi:hypothetical protein ACIBO5_48875 [Nonomuraea angiospora]|uniref:hypothetical protein n=1 Tax=Nonomuraea angiospora TaxID=46172 RepID=UPI0029ACDC0B|nr:hypothetical protein [Nonomuraea angiospora]MDX3101905.1 hypothetical protein [Nonomuraea angiospora]
MKRRRMLHALKAAQELGNYAEMPILPADVDPQAHLSRNTVMQPFWLICSKDTVLVQMSGTAVVHLKDSSVNRFSTEIGDHVYIPAGTPHRIVPGEEGVQLRYKAQLPGLEAVAWYCTGCDRELHRVDWDTAETVAQQVYYDACAEFNANEALRSCIDCGTAYPRIDMTPFSGWPEIAKQLRDEPATA